MCGWLQLWLPIHMPADWIARRLLAYCWIRLPWTKNVARAPADRSALSSWGVEPLGPSS
jgi:hypothetical protein